MLHTQCIFYIVHYITMQSQIVQGLTSCASKQVSIKWYDHVVTKIMSDTHTQNDYYNPPPTRSG